jgi:hypothetical protein
MKHTINGYITFKPAEPWEKKPTISFLTWKPDDCDNVFGFFVRPHSIEVELPDDFDPRQLQIAALERERTALRATFQARITEIEEQISKLLAIEHAPEVA